MSATAPAFALLVFSSLLAIVNPLSAIPLFVAATGDYDDLHRQAALRKAVVTAVLVLVAFALLGTWILRIFGITTDAFRVTGGLLFLGIGYDMMRAKRSRVRATKREEAEASHREDVGIIPLGIPTLAGPGAITTVVTLSTGAEYVWQRLIVLATIPVVMAASWMVLRLAPVLLQRLGTTGMNIFTRLMGLLVMVVGTQFVLTGARAAFGFGGMP
ncbi:MAG TPA: MarC family protein [Gemmatimonadaceae bacterium]|nr:MarC family protein [Gemmatimonadaceae bacterium]